MMIIESSERAKYMMLMDESRKLLLKKLKKIWDDKDFIVVDFCSDAKLPTACRQLSSV